MTKAQRRVLEAMEGGMPMPEALARFVADGQGMRVRNGLVNRGWLGFSWISYWHVTPSGRAALAAPSTVGHDGPTRSQPVTPPGGRP